MTPEEIKKIKEEIMKVTQDEPQAFPCVVTVDGTSFFIKGMPLRDWFAGMAMQSIIAHRGLGSRFSDNASDAFDMADEMLAESTKS